jgi:iron complex transport system permease protein
VTATTATQSDPQAIARAQVIVSTVRSSARVRQLRVGLGLTVTLGVMFSISVSVGDFSIPLLDVVPAMLGLGDKGSVFVVHELRLPRALAGAMVGLAFGLSGGIFQSVARNPLASPDILGITAGASAAAVLAIVAGASFVVLALSAFGGAFALSIAIYVLAYRRGVSSYRFVLVGIGLSSMAIALTSYMITRADIYEAAEANVWMIGSLNAVGWETMGPLTAVIAVLAPLALLLTGRLRALQLNDDMAKGLGVRVERSRLTLLLVGVALVAVGTAASGPIAFVAFLAPPIARRLTGAPLSLVSAALVGALIVLAADLVGRTAFSSTEIPVGIFTGLCGAPYFLWLLARANKRGLAQ